MKLTEIREELMKQHAALRDLAASARAQAAAVRAGEATALAALRDAIGKLADTLRGHNLREEELLGAVIKNIDAWGEVRASLMDEHHTSEHDGLRRALADAGDVADPAAAATKVEAVLFDLLEHMRLEEKDILHPNVLRDDIYTVDYGGG